MHQAHRAPRAVVVASALAFALAPAFARPPMDAELGAAVDLFVAGLRGSDAQKVRSAAALERVVGQPAHAADPLALAFYGAATAQLAETTWLPWKKIRYADQGVALLDRALKGLAPGLETAPAGLTPAAQEVRYVAARVFLALPSSYGRGQQGEALLGQLLAGIDASAAPADFKAGVCLLAGTHALDAARPEQARQLLQKAIDYRASPASGEAAAALAKR